MPDNVVDGSDFSGLDAIPETEKKKKRAPSSRVRSSSRRDAPTLAQIRDEMSASMVMLSGFVSAKCDRCGMHIAMMGPAWIDSLINAAEKNPRIREMLERAVTGSTLGALMFSTVALVMPIAMHHLPFFTRREVEETNASPDDGYTGKHRAADSVA